MADVIKMHFEAKYPDRLRLPLSFDPQKLAEDLRGLSSGWIRHVARQNYDGDWSAIALRAPAGERHPLRMISAGPDRKDFENTPLLDACPYFRAVMDSIGAPLRLVRLMRLTPGSTIKEHEDVALSFEEGMVRLHVPVLTHSEVDFRLNGERVLLEAGSCWYLRLTDPHSVANRGTSDRVHLVIDADVNDWLGTLFDRAAAASN